MAISSAHALPPCAPMDFDGDCKSDIVWRNSATGQNYIWLMNGLTIASRGYLSTMDDPAWQIQGMGDFDGDGKADILWRNVWTGENYIWLMNGLWIAAQGLVSVVDDPAWQVQRVGDFDGDGKADILWRNTKTGENIIWLMNGLTIASQGYVTTMADPAWQIQGVGDFDGDGKADILWRNSSTGENYLYLMNGWTIAASGSINFEANQAWQVKGIGDFDGDGKADILWRNSSTGENYIYLMNGWTITAQGRINFVDPLSGWELKGIGDFDGDGKADILWRNSSTGENYIYLMNGWTIASQGYLPTAADLSWTPRAATTRADLNGPDTLAPSTPTGLTASAVFSSRIDLSWSAATDNVGVIRYGVYRDGVQIAIVIGTSYSNTGLSPATTYSYTVAAYDAARNLSAQSSAVSATTAPADTQPPSIPTNLAATAVSAWQIDLSWSPATDNVGVAGYRVYRDGTLVASPSGTFVSITGLSASTLYSFTVSAFDAAGNVSALSAALSVTTPAPSAGPQLRSAVGTNLDAITYWSPQIPFVDVMKSSSDWVSGDASNWDNGQALDLDGNGWVRSLAPGQIARKLMLREMGDRYPAGQYLVRYKGQGTLKFGFAASILSQQQGQMVIQVTPGDDGVYLYIEATNPTDYLREIQVTLPGGICDGDPFTRVASAQDCSGRVFLSFADNSQSILFNPDFANRLRSYSVLRFMDWMGTNNSPVARWSQRTPMSYSTWTIASGAPVEVMIALANLVGAHPWFTLPHQSDDAYAQSFAQLVASQLDPNLSVYVEDSNEVWNSMFSQWKYANNQGAAQVPPIDGLQYHALRSRTLAAIFKSALGAQRVVGVLGAQAASPSTAQRGLDFLKSRFGSTNGIDAIAIAPYFAVMPSPAQASTYTGMTLDDLFTYVRTWVLPQASIWGSEYRLKVANVYGVHLISYEGGQHMVGVAGGENDAALSSLFDAFNRDPRIKQLYLDYLNNWKQQGGELFVHFNDVGRYTKWGRWGALEYVAQPRPDSPKFDGIQTFIEQNPVWWSQ